MALVLNEEQQMLKESARGFLQEHAPLAQLRRLRDERDATGYSAESWAQMVELGWAGILVPEAYGGLDFGHVGMGQVMEENGRTLTASPLFSTAILGVSALVLGGSNEQKKILLPAIVEGSLTLALALDEGPKHNPAQVTMTASKGGAESNNFKLNGAKQFVADGHVAEKLIVSARTSIRSSAHSSTHSSVAPDDNDGISVFLVDRDAEGVTVERVMMADSRNSAMVTFDNVVVPQGAMLGQAGKGLALIEGLTDIGNAHLAAELLGISLEVFERTVQYMQERKQFGVLIGSYQGLQHRAAHLFSEIELTKSVVIKALQGLDEKLLDENSDAASLLCSMAKAKASEVAALATNESVQLHGGIGMTDEYDMGFYMKRARVAEHMLGDQRFHQRRFAALSGY
ncbi:MAG: acyl-CoA dehydrogenase family protein [Porticoccaceae bacterium]